MISQFDHLTLLTPHFEEHCELLETLGYKRRFLAPTLFNPRIKKPLVTYFSEAHTLALYDAPHSLSIEVIEEKNPSGTRSCMVPIFQNVPKSLIESETPVRIGNDTRIETRLKGLETPVYTTRHKNGNFAFTSFVLKVRDVEGNRATWEALGWKSSLGITDADLLIFRSPLHSFPAMLYIVQDESAETLVPLDSHGFNYVALVSTSASKERERLEKQGLGVTPLETHEVNGKSLDMFFVTGEHIQPVEVLGVH